MIERGSLVFAGNRSGSGVYVKIGGKAEGYGIPETAVKYEANLYMGSKEQWAMSNYSELDHGPRDAEHISK